MQTATNRKAPMRLHTDYHNPATIAAALINSGLRDEGVSITECAERGSRSRSRAYEVRLGATPGRDRHGKARRPANSGTRGADGGKAATYDEWGHFIAALYADEANMVFGSYTSAEVFERLTRYAFDIPAPAARECSSRCVDTCALTGRRECGRAAA